MKTERWLPVVGYEGLYEVSDLGRVRGLDRKALSRWGTLMRVPGKTLSQTVSNGYLKVGLWRDGKSETPHVHCVVAEAFIGPRPDGLQVCHGPTGDRDNSASNLRYDTVARNHADKTIHGTMAIRERNGQSKLTSEQVLIVRSDDRRSYRQIATEFGVSVSAIGAVKRRQNWRSL